MNSPQGQMDSNDDSGPLSLKSITNSSGQTWQTLAYDVKDEMKATRIRPIPKWPPF